MKLYDSELKVMELLWKEGEMTASRMAKILKEETGWNKNTTYTVIKKCIAKNAVERREPGFLCAPLVSKADIQIEETNELVDKIFEGSKIQLFASLLSNEMLTDDEIRNLKELIDSIE